ncbi:MAG: YkvA family protein [Leptolyngbyaceae cyanobacterium]
MANWFGSALKASKSVASSVGKTLGETAAGLASTAGKTASSAGQTIGETSSDLASAAGSLGKNISAKTTNLVQAVRGWRPFSDDDTLAFFAVLFAVAAVDKQVSEAELQMILASPEAKNLSADQQKILQSYSYNPPPLKESMEALAEADQELKFGLIFCILNLVCINGEMSDAESDAIALAQDTFEINDVQLEAIREFIQLLAKAKPEQNQEALPELKTAAERMISVGIPVKALAYAQEQAMSQMDYSDAKFLHKMKTFGAQAGQAMVEQVYIMWYALHSSKTPASAKLVIAGALAYWILPVDMVPDVLPAVGFTDDFTTIASALASVAMSITPDIRAKAKLQTNALFDEPEGFSADAVKPSGDLA